MAEFSPRKILLRSVAALVLALLGLVVVLWLKPPELLRVGANYTAKIVCSNVFLAGRDPDQVLRTDVQAPGVAMLRLMRVSVDRNARVVRAGLFGFIGNGLALARPGVGCAAVPDGNLGFARQADAATPPAPTTPAAPGALWPEGSAVAADAAVQSVLADDVLAGAGMRAMVVVHRGRLVAERYAPGFATSTPLLGWSLTKSVVAGLVGLLVKEGKLALDQSAGWPPAPGDARSQIRLADLLSMSSGLRFNEAYGTVSDVTRMLYLQPDTAGFARSQPSVHPPGEVWNYSSGTANIVARLVQDAAGPVGAALPQTALFAPLGMTSATMETDEDGTLVGSSYMYATARDWARFGLFLAQDGIWQGKAMLPAGFVAMMRTPVPASHGEYGQGFVWLRGSDAANGINPDRAFGLPEDCFWLEGHDGQSIAVIPSRQLVVVRLGLTPESQHYQPQPLVRAALESATSPD